MPLFERALKTGTIAAGAIALAPLLIHQSESRSLMGLEAVNSYTVQLYDTSLRGSQVTHMREITARRFDGSRVEIREQPISGAAGEWVARKTIRFSDGISVESRSDTRAKTTISHDPKGEEWINQSLNAIDPASDCRRNFHGKSWSTAPIAVEGYQSVKGYNALRFRFTEANGDVVSEWRSPVFGCEIVREDRVARNGAVEHKIPLLLEMGEPDATIFEVPRDYRETGAARRGSTAPGRFFR